VNYRAVYSNKDVTLVAGGSKTHLRVFNFRTQELVCEYALAEGALVSSILVSNEHLLCATTDNVIMMISIPLNRVVNSFRGHTDVVRCMKYDENANLLVSGSIDKTIRMWNTKTGDCKILQGHTMSVICIHFEINENLLVSGSGDHKMRAWNMSSGECEKVIDTGSVIYAIAFNTRCVVTANKKPGIIIWDRSEWTQLHSINLNFYGIATCLLMDEKKIVTGTKTMLAFHFDKDEKCISSSQDENQMILDANPCIPPAHRRSYHLDKWYYVAIVVVIINILQFVVTGGIGFTSVIM